MHSSSIAPSRPAMAFASHASTSSDPQRNVGLKHRTLDAYDAELAKKAEKKVVGSRSRGRLIGVKRSGIANFLRDAGIFDGHFVRCGGMMDSTVL